MFYNAVKDEISSFTALQCVCVCMYVCTYVCMCVYIYIYICIYIYIYTLLKDGSKKPKHVAESYKFIKCWIDYIILFN